MDPTKKHKPTFPLLSPKTVLISFQCNRLFYSPPESAVTPKCSKDNRYRRINCLADIKNLCYIKSCTKCNQKPTFSQVSTYNMEKFYNESVKRSYRHICKLNKTSAKLSL